MSAAHRLVTALFALLLAGCATAQGRGVDYYLTGSAADRNVAPAAVTSLLLAGGGTDVDDAMRWFVGRAGGGDVVVLRASGSDGYNRYLYEMGGIDSVETLVVKTRSAASDPFVIDKIDRAEAVFLAGGDQADYVKLWKDTPLEAAIDRALARKAAVGGTSAGLAVLGAIDFAALRGTVDSPEALADCYARRITLDRGFVAAPGLDGAITDSHFRNRDRMGRLVVFLARAVQDGWVAANAARAVGIDEATALIVDDGRATRLGRGSAYFLQSTLAPAECRRGQPVTLRNVLVDRLSGSGRFDLTTWAAEPGATTRYELSAERGTLLSTQPGGSVY